MSPSAADQRIRTLRPPKPRVDPYVAHGSILEQERRPDGTIEQALTVFLAGAECPFTCSFCDLWRYTTDGPTAPGALTRQLRGVLDSVDLGKIDRLKLYNASNFFDPRAVPPEDARDIGELARDFRSVTVESHVRTIGPRTLTFAKALAGRLEVALGLETIHPTALTRLNKRLDLAQFDRAAGFLHDNDIDMRVFVLLGAPYVPAAESVEWTVRTVAYAAARGAATISVIPVRGGNGELERLEALGEFRPPTLSDLEEVVARVSSGDGRSVDGASCGRAVVTADLWDAERLTGSDCCRAARVDRLRGWNLTAKREAEIDCAVCHSGGPT